MKRPIQLLFFAIVCFLCNVVTAQKSLESGFENPPTSSKARTWWHWVNGNVSKEGITADLEAMKDIGIQEAQIFNVDFGYPEGPAKFLTPAWLELFKFAVIEAKRLGMELGFNNGAGWSSSGGPWIKPKNAMQTVVYSQIEVKGGHRIHQILPMPPTRLDYYKEIAVVAFPTPKSDRRIDELALKTLSGNSFRMHLDPAKKIIEEDAIIDTTTIVNLTSRMSENGMVDWEAPEGDWTILRFGYTPTGTENHPTGPGGKGLECDKMSKVAVDAYWNGGIQPILDKLGELAGTTLNNCLIDSYEVGCSNWTGDFESAFVKRRGYQLFKFLPTLAGYYVGSGEISERFLWDFRKTISDLMIENYYGHFRELCHEHGLKFSVEPYGGPFEDLKAGSTGDVVMGEFWVGDNVYLESPRLAASVAHLNGGAIVGAESFTSFGGWLNHPATLKQIGDQAWTEGVNRFIFHSYVHQPWNKPPGLTFGVYGIEMNRLNTWWQQSRDYMRYIARSQFLLQQGRSFADVLVFSGESVPNDAIMRPDIKEMGYDYDQIGPADIIKLRVKDGLLCTPAGGRYHLLILPDTEWATPELLLKIKKLVLAGAIVKGTPALKSPSLNNYPDCDAKVKKLAKEIWPVKHGMSRGYATLDTITEVFRHLELAPDFSAGPTGADLNYIHRVKGSQDIYFIENPQKASRRELCRFRITGKRPAIWNPQTGEMNDAVVWSQKADGTIEIPLFFNSQQSIFVIFKKDRDLSADHLVASQGEIPEEQPRQLPKLQVIKAQYGVFLPVGMVDVTDGLEASRTKAGLTLFADNRYGSGDPAPGSIKELRVVYELEGRTYNTRLLENEHQFIQTGNKEFKLVRALYGKFPQGFKIVPPKHPIADVTDKVRSLLDANRFVFAVSDHLFGEDLLKSDPADEAKELHLEYRTADGKFQVSVPDGRLVHLEQDRSGDRLAMEKGSPTWITPYPGTLHYKTQSGKEGRVRVNDVESPLRLNGSWEIHFPDKKGAPPEATLKKLMSWTESSIPGIRYFSGTATYNKTFIIPENALKDDCSVELDLGKVAVIAEVILNGKNLGVLWKAPFRIDLGKTVHAGENKLEIKVTNLWPNRLIGDEQLPADMEWKNGIPASWPNWLSDRQSPDTSGRITFTSYKHYDKDSKLLTSGLLGPVVVRFYRHVRLW